MCMCPAGFGTVIWKVKTFGKFSFHLFFFFFFLYFRKGKFCRVKVENFEFTISRFLSGVVVNILKGESFDFYYINSVDFLLITFSPLAYTFIIIRLCELWNAKTQQRVFDLF